MKLERHGGLVSSRVAHLAHGVCRHCATSVQIRTCTVRWREAVRQSNLRSALSENQTQPKVAFFVQNQTETDRPQKMWNCNNRKWFISLPSPAAVERLLSCAGLIATSRRTRLKDSTIKMFKANKYQWWLFGQKIKMTLMISIHLENDLIWNHLQNDNSDFDFKSVFKAWFWFEIMLKMISPNTVDNNPPHGCLPTCTHLHPEVKIHTAILVSKEQVWMITTELPNSQKPFVWFKNLGHIPKFTC